MKVHPSLKVSWKTYYLFSISVEPLFPTAETPAQAHEEFEND